MSTSTFPYLKGVYNITPTPFQPDGSLDLPSLARLTEATIAAGVDGMTILGVMGEASKVTDAEREQIIATVIETAAGRIPICVGTTHAATDPCVTYSRQAQAMGAQALMVAPPRLARSTDAALRRHYLAVAEAVDIPVVVQDHPPSSGVFMSVEFIAALADEAPHCRFLKLEDEPTPPKLSLVHAANPRVEVFGGSGGMWYLEELRRGAIGIMTGFGVPEILVEIYHRWSEGDQAGATETFYRYCPMIRFENQPGLSLTIRKHIYALRGAIASPHTRQPAPTLDPGSQADLMDLLTRLNLLPSKM
ncbi:MAG: dihydrodipicolinate synthase family protein [Anaerolineae bacterium]